MNEILCKELITLLKQMFTDNVQLIHGGQLIEWEETKIPELVQKIEVNLELNRNNLNLESNNN